MMMKTLAMTPQPMLMFTCWTETEKLKNMGFYKASDVSLWDKLTNFGVKETMNRLCEGFFVPQGVFCTFEAG